jgi:DNA (cytosine-5)-methyltransferase 1
MIKPRLLDLFCGAGGAAMGYHRAGFEVVGVDHKPMPRYPFEFHQADALEFCAEHGHEYDAIHASPPCQGYSSAIRHLANKTPKMIDAVRNLLEAYKVWVIENVIGSPIPSQNTLWGDNGLMLCGTMLGLSRVYRHRLFLSSIPLVRPSQDCTHREYALNPYNANSRKRDGIQHNALRRYAETMEIDWMVGDEIGEAIPPAYTEFIGKQLREYLRA